MFFFVLGIGPHAEIQLLAYSMCHNRWASVSCLCMLLVGQYVRQIGDNAPLYRVLIRYRGKNLVQDGEMWNL